MIPISNQVFYYLIRLTNKILQFAIGIADGVGGWKQYGVDPSLFSHFLMKNCERYVKDNCVNSFSPKKILQAGYDNLISEHPDLLGVFQARDYI